MQLPLVPRSAPLRRARLGSSASGRESTWVWLLIAHWGQVLLWVLGGGAAATGSKGRSANRQANLATLHFPLGGQKEMPEEQPRSRGHLAKAGTTVVQGSEAVEEIQPLQSRHPTQRPGEKCPPSALCQPRDPHQRLPRPNMPGSEMGSRDARSLWDRSGGKSGMDLGGMLDGFEGLQNWPPGSVPQPTTAKS